MSTRRAARERGALEDRPTTGARAARAVRAARLPDFSRGGAAAAVAEDVEARGSTSTPLRAAAVAAAAAAEAAAAAAAAATSATTAQGANTQRNRRYSRHASGEVGDAAAPGGYIGDGGGGGNNDGESGSGGDDDFGEGAVHNDDPADQPLEQGENGESGGEEETEFPTDCPCGRQNYEPTTGQYVLCETCWSWKHSSCEALSDEAIVAMDVACVCSRCDALGKTRAPERRVKGTHGTAKCNRKCTSYCPGCRNGGGCEEGMGPLAVYVRQGILQFQLDVVSAQEKRMKHRKSGETVLVQKLQPSTKSVRAIVVRWAEHEVEIVHETDWGKDLAKRKREILAATRVFRTPPALSDADLEAHALRLGCIRSRPYMKQLLYEMRKARAYLKVAGRIEKGPRTKLLICIGLCGSSLLLRFSRVKSARLIINIYMAKKPAWD